MHVLLNADPHSDGRHQMAEHLETVVLHALARYREQVTRVEAHIADESGHVHSQPGQVQCTLEARLVGLEPVVVKDHAATAHQAIHEAVAKLQRAIGTALGKHADH